MKILSLLISLTFVMVAKAQYQNCYLDVEKNFSHINSQPNTVNKLRPNKYFGITEYKLAATNKFGIDNHFQGLSQINNGYVISGADYKKRVGHIFVLQANGVVQKAQVGTRANWHIGGIQASGNIVAISLEPYKVESEQKYSILQLWDFSNIQSPTLIKNSQITNIPAYTPAAGIVRLGNGQYLIGQLSHRFELYLSNSANLNQGINPRPIPSTQDKISATSFSLIRQCDGKIYLVTFDNEEGKIPVPITKGKNFATLYEVAHEGRIGKGGLHIKKLNRRFFTCNRKCSFRAAGSIKNLGNGSFSIISTKMFRKYVTGQLYVAEFSPIMR